MLRPSLLWITFCTAVVVFAASGPANEKLADQFATRLHHIQQNGLSATHSSIYEERWQLLTARAGFPS